MAMVKWIVLGFSAIALALGFAANLHSFGGQGIFTLALCGLPLLLVGACTAMKRPFGRADEAFNGYKCTSQLAA